MGLHIGAILFIGIAFRLLAGGFSTGFTDPNEVYRLLEPIAHFQGYGTRLPWEWMEGLLSPLPAFFHWKWLSVSSALGFDTAWSQALLLRIVYAVASAIAIWATWVVLISTGTTRKIASYAALLVAIAPELIFRSARLMDYSLEIIFYSLILICIFTRNQRFTLAGIFFAILFFIRYQSGLFFIATAIGLLIKKEKKGLLQLTLAYGMGVLVLGFAETWLTSQSFLAPFFNYLNFNLVQDGATVHYGADPWHRYLSETGKIYGFLPLLFLVPFALRKKANLQLQILFFLPFLVYTLIPHKEDRFIIGFIWLLIPLAFSNLKKIPVGSLVLLAFLVGWSVQLKRVLPRWNIRSETVRAFADVGEKTKEEIPILIQGDPDFLPGGFFLRHASWICYPGSRFGNCPARVGRHYQLLNKVNNSWELQKKRQYIKGL